jgi:hypothetical protein
MDNKPASIAAAWGMAIAVALAALWHQEVQLVLVCAGAAAIAGCIFGRLTAQE